MRIECHHPLVNGASLCHERILARRRPWTRRRVLRRVCGARNAAEQHKSGDECPGRTAHCVLLKKDGISHPHQEPYVARKRCVDLNAGATWEIVREWGSFPAVVSSIG